MNSSYTRDYDCYQSNMSYYWPNYGCFYRNEEQQSKAENQITQNIEPSSKLPEQTEAEMKGEKVEKEEVYKDDFVSGFVPGHNHGSVDYTAVEEGHVHQCLDITFPPKRLGDGTHIHYTEGYTMFEDGHYHHYKSWSGPAISVGNGMHVHYYDFYTTMNDGHRHRIKGVDMPAPGNR